MDEVMWEKGEGEETHASENKDQIQRLGRGDSWCCSLPLLCLPLFSLTLTFTCTTKNPNDLLIRDCEVTMPVRDCECAGEGRNGEETQNEEIFWARAQRKGVWEG